MTTTSTARGSVDLTGDGGVLKRVLRRSSSSELHPPQRGDEVSVHYVGTIERNGEEFDSSKEFGDTYSKPFTFPVGEGKVVKGFDLAVLSMRVGELASFTLRADYAYGKDGCPGRGLAPDIAPDETLIFELELMSVRKDTGKDEDDRAKRLYEIRQKRDKAAKEKAAKDIQRKKKERERKKASAKKTNETSQSGPLGKVAIKKMKPKDLKKRLKSLGLSTQGPKKVLQERLIEASCNN